MRELPKEFDKPKIDRFAILFPDVVKKFDEIKAKKEQIKKESCQEPQSTI